MRALQTYRRLACKYPLRTSFGVCFVKGVVSDAFAQKCIERGNFNPRRNLAFATFSGAYLGCGQHYVYNVAFTRMFGTSTTFLTGLQKTAADLFGHTPFMYLPLYYAFEDTALGGSVTNGLTRLYGRDPETGLPTELLKVVSQYACIFPLVHLINFTITPIEMRIGVVACTSVVWLVVLSTISHTVSS